MSKGSSDSLLAGYGLYSKALLNFIENSNSRYTVGVYGEWGMGKTVLMKSVYNALKNDHKNINPVWINAWQYEAEPNYALLPILREMAGALKIDAKDIKKEKLKTAIIGVCKSLLKSSPYVLSMFLPGLNVKLLADIKDSVKAGGDTLADSIDKATEKIVDDLLYSEGLKKIEDAIEQMEDKRFRIVVFVDDLDRCSPKKVLEVFESIKVLFDIEGFVFVIGIDPVELPTIIERVYHKEKGEEYLERIIQVPIILPPWNNNDIKNLIIKNTLNNSDEDKSGYIKNNISIITKVVENNPKRTERLIENLMFTFSVYEHRLQNKEIDLSPAANYKPYANEEQTLAKDEFARRLIIIQIINFKWNEIYRLILDSSCSDRNKFFNIIKSIDSNKMLNSSTYRKAKFFLLFIRLLANKKVRRLVRRYGQDITLIEFLKVYSKDINDVELISEIKKISQVTGIVRNANVPQSQVITKKEDKAYKKKSFLQRMFHRIIHVGRSNK